MTPGWLWMNWKERLKVKSSQGASLSVQRNYESIFDQITLNWTKSFIFSKNSWVLGLPHCSPEMLLEQQEQHINHLHEGPTEQDERAIVCIFYKGLKDEGRCYPPDSVQCGHLDSEWWMKSHSCQQRGSGAKTPFLGEPRLNLNSS